MLRLIPSRCAFDLAAQLAKLANSNILTLSVGAPPCLACRGLARNLEDKLPRPGALWFFLSTPPVWCAPPDSCVRSHQRISVAWCKQFDVPLNKVLTKTLLEKFTWATHVEADFGGSE